MSLQALRKSYATDKKLEQEGVWYSPPDLPHIGFLLARQAHVNRGWQTKVTALYSNRVYKKLFDKNDIYNPVLHAKLVEMFCESILLNWRGITNDEGVEIPYTKAAGVKLLTELPDLYHELSNEASTTEKYRREDVEEIAKKSVTT